MSSQLHKQLKAHGLTVFVDAKQFLRGLRSRLPWSVARRQAEYVLIDHHRVPVGVDLAALMQRHLARLDHVRDGLGYTHASAVPRPAPAQPAGRVNAPAPMSTRAARPSSSPQGAAPSKVPH